MKQEEQEPQKGNDADLCECGFSEESHCMACGECPQDEDGTLGDYCGALGLWTEDGEVEAPCISERMLICPWCGSDVMKDGCKHTVVTDPGQFGECPVEIDCELYSMAYEPMSAPGNSSVAFLYVIEDSATVEKIQNWLSA